MPCERMLSVIPCRLKPSDHAGSCHLSCRAGRAGNKGTAITFIAPEDDKYAPDLVKALKESAAPIPKDLQVAP